MTALLKQLTEEYLEHRDPKRAFPMAAYMRDQFPFLGIPTPERRAIDRGVTSGRPPPSEAELANFANACWHRKEREFQYFACDYVARHVRRCSARFLDTACVLICTKSWWDTIDTLAQNTVGTLVREHPELTATMDEWIDEDNFWLVRTAILHQNRWKDATDADRLFDYCTRQAGNPEFFVRKAIGWALREYSKTDARAVRSFVKTHERELSGLSRTEALKWLARRRA